MPPKRKLSRTRKAMELARKRKPTGRINKDDIANALSSLGLTPGLKAKLIKQMKQAGGITSSDALKSVAAQLKRKQRQFTAAGRQSKGPVGTKLKKVSKLKF